MIIICNFIYIIVVSVYFLHYEIVVLNIARNPESCLFYNHSILMIKYKIYILTIIDQEVKSLMHIKCQ